MSIHQAYNSSFGAWVKYKLTKKGLRILAVKQKLPKQKFEGIEVRTKK